MTPRDISSEGREALGLIQRAAALSGEWPRYENFLQECDSRGIDEPHALIQEWEGDLLRFESPLQRLSILSLRAQGWDLARPRSTFIHDGFVTAVRQCVERVRREKPETPGQPRRLTVQARELWEPRANSELPAIGLLLEAHDFGEITWDRLDRRSPFRIKLNPLVVRRFASVGSFVDFVTISDASTPLQAVA